MNWSPASGDSINFWDAATSRECCYVYPGARHSTAGWILFRHPDGQWVTWRKATEMDIEIIIAAVIEAHHAD